MPVVPIQIPPGMDRNGTPYSQANRWADGNLVRFHDKAVRSIGGWERRRDSSGDLIPTLHTDTTESVRDIKAHRINSGLSEIILGSNSRLLRLNSGGSLSDITPAGFTSTDNDVTLKTGFGVGPYGRGPYGTPRNASQAEPVPVSRWSFDSWGENIIAAFSGGGPIYQYKPGDPAALALSNAPTDVTDCIVTDQRILMAIKHDATEIRQVIWSDREDNNEWTASQTNFAGAQVLQGDGFLRGMYKVLNQILILSDTDAYVARYIGAPFVYGFERVGDQCAPLDRKAVVSTKRFAVWPGTRNFWIYDGTLRKLDCEVMDYVANDIDANKTSKIHATTIARFKEVWWFYQAKGSSEVDSYVMWDYSENVWHTGNLTRLASHDDGVLRSPIMIDKDGYVFNHEQQSIKADGAFISSGPLELQSGQRNMAVRYVYPDTQAIGDVQLTFATRQMPTETDVMHGPYAYENPISTTGVLGREVRMRADLLTNRGELGTMRYDVQEIGGGKR